MQHLCHGSRRHQSISGKFRACQGQVRFFALHRIKPHTPPLVRAPVNSFEFQSCDRTPQAANLRVSFDTESQIAPNIQFASFRAWTTRVYNPVCSPRFRASVSVLVQAVAFATDVPPDLYAFPCYTGTSTTLYRTLACQYPITFPGLARVFHTLLNHQPTHALRPVITNN